GILTMSLRPFRRFSLALALCALAAYAPRLLSAAPPIAEATAPTAPTTIAKPADVATAADVVTASTGCRVFICGHSFHIFNAQYLVPLCEVAGLSDHEIVGKQMIGGSSVTQHWNLPDDKNRVKEALVAGNVDVLTLSPNWVIPDPAIDKFVELGLKHNPRMKFVVQMSWTAFDGWLRGGLTNLGERNNKTIAELRPAQIAFATAIELQVQAINAKYDRPVVAISPVGYAVLKLREAVIDGKAPGIKRQSDLYRDLLGHGQPPILALCTYVNYATIYGRSPVGLKPFDTFNGTVSPELHKLLQEIAWETVSKYKPSGVVVDGE
ncbi:MAG: hypothetical protein J0M17_15490, partial [Planctomycetes bacterium]|nr:hypothetical protein [Planctomycetota bacterium]